MKKVIAVSLALCLLSSALSACKTAGHTGDETTTFRTESTAEEPHSAPESPVSDFEYVINEDDGISITRYIGQNRFVVIPADIEGKPVTKIGEAAFQESSVIIVEMPDSITVIDGRAFLNCDTLVEITLSNSLYEIGIRAFYNCSALKNIKIPSSVRVLKDEAFCESGLQTVDIQDGLEVIPPQAFYSTKLISLFLPSSIKTISYGAFAGCQRLENVKLNDGLVTIETRAFAGDIKLKEIIIPKTVETITDMSFSMCTRLESVKFEGNAPSTFKEWDPVAGEISDPSNTYFFVYCHEEAEGFTSPEWNGYPTAIW